MGHWAIILNNTVNCITIADEPLNTGELWVSVDGMDPRPEVSWKYDDGVFTPPPAPPDPADLPAPKTEEQKLADAVAAAIAKLVADGVLKQ